MEELCFFLNRRLLITRSLQSRRNTSSREISLTSLIKVRWRKRSKETLKWKTRQRTTSSRRLTLCLLTARRRWSYLSQTNFTILALTNCLWNYSFLSSSIFKSSVRRSYAYWATSGPSDWIFSIPWRLSPLQCYRRCLESPMSLLVYREWKIWSLQIVSLMLEELLLPTAMRSPRGSSLECREALWWSQIEAAGDTPLMS